MQRKFKYVLIALVLVIILGAAFALAAANTIPASTAGSGTSTVSGYTVSNIAYDRTSALTRRSLYLFRQKQLLELGQHARWLTAPSQREMLPAPSARWPFQV